jgi:DNA-binding NarL/FixJ family response regulator
LFTHTSTRTVEYIGALQQWLPPREGHMPPKRILIVDDNDLVRYLVRTILETQPGFEVCEEAADGVEAIERAAKSKPDLIVLDFSMPRMNGLQTAANLRDVAPNVPIILFTLYKDEVPEMKAQAAGIRAVVSKTGQMGGLLQEIHRVLETPRFATA